ncbi:MAG TPA: proton-conducting transporter membrane subunit [Polyangia bacterium]
MSETLHQAAEFTTGIGPAHAVGFLFLIPLLPLLGAAINGLLGYFLQKRFGKKAISLVAVAVMVAASLVAVYGFVQLLMLPAGERTMVNRLLPMIHIGALRLDLSFMMDELSGTMALIVTIIGTLIHVYSTGYMHDEKSYWRYFAYLNLFVFSMMMLVLGDSFLLMFFGWEGVGLCSYLLIGFWYQDKLKAQAGMKAFIVNRVGDFGFLVGLMFLFWSLGGVWAGASYAPNHGLGTEPGRHVQRVVLATPEGVSHGAAHGGAHGAPAHAAAPLEVTLGPTVSFRELKGQLTLKDAHGRRPLVEGGEVAAQPLAAAHAAAAHATPAAVEKIPVTYPGLGNVLVFGLPVLFLVCLGFFVGATGKSAQIPLYVWLPDAMAGPTPVSALIHAATMVTAGVYMVARLNFLFALSPGAMTVVALVGALTAFFAATIGLFQYDIKKVLAYSTVSQLGYMFVAVGVGAYWVGVFHLLTHAAFKACLFLGSGSVIHGMHYVQHHGHGHGHEPLDPRLHPDPQDPQDMRNMGGLAKLMPTTRWTYLVACIAIAGFPIASGFFSKDEILFKAFTSLNIAAWAPKLVWALCAAGAALTAFYMFRSYYMTFYFRAPSADHTKHVHESPRSMTWVLAALAILAVVLSFIGLPKLWTHRDPLFERFLHPVFSSAALRGFTENHGLEAGLMLLSIGIALAGWYVARSLYLDEAKSAARLASLKEAWAPVHRTVFRKYYVDEIYAATVIRGTLGLSAALAWFDRELIDGLVNFVGALGRATSWINGKIDQYFVDGAVNLVASSVIAGGRQLRKMQTGRITSYAYGIAVGVIAIAVIAYLLPGALK